MSIFISTFWGFQPSTSFWLLSELSEKEEAIEQLQAIASALSNSQDSAMKKAAKKAMKGLGGTAFTLPSEANIVTLCNQLPELISQIFK